MPDYTHDEIREMLGALRKEAASISPAAPATVRLMHEAPTIIEQLLGEVERAEQVVMDYENECSCLPEDRSVPEMAEHWRAEIATLRAQLARAEQRAERAERVVEASRYFATVTGHGSGCFCMGCWRQNQPGPVRLRESLRAYDNDTPGADDG